MADTRQDKDRLIAACATAIVLAVLLMWIALSRFTIDLAALADRTWPPVDSSEIVFGGEFVKMGNMATPTPSKAKHQASETQNVTDPSHEGTDMADAGQHSAEAPDMVTSELPSAAKVEQKPKPEKTGPTKEELAERERIRREKEEAEKSKRISSGLKNAFNKPTTSAQGTEGSPAGNSTSGAVSGSPGYSLNGRTPEGWGRPSSSFGGTITIRVKVNRQGYVTDARYVSGTGAAAAQTSVRNSCIAAARQSRFSVDENAPVEQTGTITWTFR